MSRIGRRLAELASSGRKALVIYLTAGDPDFQSSRSLVLAAEKAGADIIELGVPFSDPSADGPVLQQSSLRALRAGTNLRGVLELVRSLRTETEVPLLLFGYYNPIMTFGEDALARAAAAAGVDGLLVVDLPPEEAQGLRAACYREGLDLVPLLAPTSTPERIERARSVASGFVYYVSVTGVTGAPLADISSVAATIAALKNRLDLPIAVGFGIRRADDAALLARVADAVVVGSAAVRAAESGTEELSKLVRELKASLGPAS